MGVQHKFIMADYILEKFQGMYVTPRSCEILQVKGFKYPKIHPKNYEILQLILPIYTVLFKILKTQ